MLVWSNTHQSLNFLKNLHGRICFLILERQEGEGREREGGRKGKRERKKETEKERETRM